MDETVESLPSEKASRAKKDSKFFFGTGAGIGAYGTAAALATGYICPVCVIAAPAFLGVGVYQRNKAKKMEQAADGDSNTVPGSPADK